VILGGVAEAVADAMKRIARTAGTIACLHEVSFSKL
jgi:hypothetical protein